MVDGKSNQGVKRNYCIAQGLPMNFLNHKELKIIMAYHRDQRCNYPKYFSAFLNYNFLKTQFSNNLFSTIKFKIAFFHYEIAIQTRPKKIVPCLFVRLWPQREFEREREREKWVRWWRGRRRRKEGPASGPTPLRRSTRRNPNLDDDEIRHEEEEDELDRKR
jgi:hypothetical protein